MKVLILSFSANQVNDDSFIPNKMGLTFSCVEVCKEELKSIGIEVEHICISKRNIQRCISCGERGWGVCLEDHRCFMNDDFNETYNIMGEYDGYIFITPVYFWEMSESAKAFFDRLKRCDSFNASSNIKGKEFISIACAGESGDGTENTLHEFDVLNHFLKMDMIGRIPVTKYDFEESKQEISKCINEFNK
jgi:multimeric flavodoxin WrbA